MDDIRTTRNNVIFGVIILVLVGIAVMYVFTGENSGGNIAANPEYEIVLASIKQIQELKIAGSVLDHAGFQGLQDFSVPVSPTTPPGRANPFLSF